MPTFKFASYSVFKQYIKSPVELDVLGIVLAMWLPRYIPREGTHNLVQEAVILNAELNPILLTFRDNIVNQDCVRLYAQRMDHPVIALCRVRVVPYNGMSLATRSWSSLSISPPIPEAIELKQWYEANKEKTDKLFNAEDYFSAQDIDGPLHALEIKTLQVASSMPINTTFWAKVTIALLDYEQRFYFMCCPKCRKSTGCNPGDTFTCNYCTVANVIPIPRCVVQLQLSDNTGKISAYAYGNVAEEILNCTAVQLMETLMAGNGEAIKLLVSIEVDVLKLVRVRISQNHFEQNGIKRFSISETQLLPNEEKISKLEEDDLKVLSAQPITSVVSTAAESSSASEKKEDEVKESTFQQSLPQDSDGSLSKAPTET